MKKLTLLIAVAALGILVYKQMAKEAAPAEQASAQALPSYSPQGAIEDEIINGDTTLLELPRLAGGNNNYFVMHRASGKVNYSLEYDITKLHSRWVAFSFDAATAEDNVRRSDAWSWDPKIPAAYDTSNFFRRSGYSRGHLVASEDRTFSQAANEQTFYYTNMSPQLQTHNAGIWHRLENRVQEWARDRAFCDRLYVAKGGTIRDDQVESKKVRGVIVVPKYYWMALVMKKGSTYHGIGFLVEHRFYGAKTSMRSVALSIDELETKLGMDLFHNFPDDIEQQFEAESPATPATLSYWPGL